MPAYNEPVSEGEFAFQPTLLNKVTLNKENEE
jgi:hypothetical protein